MEKDQKRQIEVKADKWVKEFVSGKSKVFYEIQVKFVYNQWVLRKRYSDFEAMHKSLRQTFQQLPALPSKSMFALKKDVDIEKRRVKLDLYLKTLVARAELYSDANFIKFFEVGKFWIFLDFFFLKIFGNFGVFCSVLTVSWRKTSLILLRTRWSW